MNDKPLDRLALKERAENLIDVLQMQIGSAPTIFMTTKDLLSLIDILKDYFDRINQGCSSECVELIRYLESQLTFSPNLFLKEEHINILIDYLEVYINMDDNKNDQPYISPSQTKPLYGKCVLQLYFQNEEEYEKWKQFNQRYKWAFDHTYPAIMRAEYEFHTVYDVELMTKEIVSLLEMGFDVRAVDWKLKEYESQLKKG